MLRPLTETFPETARRELAALTRDHGFDFVAEDQYHVRLESRSLVVDVWHDPRGEVEVRVSRLATADPYEAWTYAGMVGTASVARLLEIAVDQMSANPEVLRGDEAFYKRLGDENRQLAEAWTAYYSGKGPQPTGKLPK
jgi:hypothetical protein